MFTNEAEQRIVNRQTSFTYMFWRFLSILLIVIFATLIYTSFFSNNEVEVPAEQVETEQAPVIETGNAEDVVGHGLAILGDIITKPFDPNAQATVYPPRLQPAPVETSSTNGTQHVVSGSVIPRYIRDENGQIRAQVRDIMLDLQSGAAGWVMVQPGLAEDFNGDSAFYALNMQDLTRSESGDLVATQNLLDTAAATPISEIASMMEGYFSMQSLRSGYVYDDQANHVGYVAGLAYDGVRVQYVYITLSPVIAGDGGSVEMGGFYPVQISETVLVAQDGRVDLQLNQNQTAQLAEIVF